MKKITQGQRQILLEMFNAELDKLGLTEEEFEALMSGGDRTVVVERISFFVRRLRALVSTKKTKFVLEVNYDLSIEDALEACEYNWRDPRITSQNFPGKRMETHQIVLCLVSFNREISSANVARRLDLENLRPAEIRELLALGAEYPELYVESQIVALGSFGRDPIGNWKYPYLCRDGQGCFVGLKAPRVWGDIIRFAAVPK